MGWLPFFLRCASTADLDEKKPLERGLASYRFLLLTVTASTDSTRKYADELAEAVAAELKSEKLFDRIRIARIRESNESLKLSIHITEAEDGENLSRNFQTKRAAILRAQAFLIDLNAKRTIGSFTASSTAWGEMNAGSLGATNEGGRNLTRKALASVVNEIVKYLKQNQ